ncbi:MAG: SDR family NAD(P)-dependent oxidoreductase [Dehalococcoidia bacterium]|nr:SDR family NAD(P)-dependent oxidoreductase [Dehalococcoidia bacterium]
MKEFAGRVAVITGAASGIGFGLARRFAQDGMHIVLADIESEPLAIAEAALNAMGTTTLAVRTDVTSPEQVERLAEAAFSTFGNVHILCNNAGVAGKFSMGTAGWEIPLSEWQWVLSVNLMGVLHGVRAFLGWSRTEEAHRQYRVDCRPALRCQPLPRRKARSGLPDRGPLQGFQVAGAGAFGLGSLSGLDSNQPHGFRTKPSARIRCTDGSLPAFPDGPTSLRGGPQCGRRWHLSCRRGRTSLRSRP